MFDFRQITLFCLEKRLLKHKMTLFSKTLGGPWPLCPPGYAYDLKLQTYKHATAKRKIIDSRAEFPMKIYHAVSRNSV